MGMFKQFNIATNERNKLQMYATICVHFKRIMLSKSSQEDMSSYCVIPLK